MLKRTISFILASVLILSNAAVFASANTLTKETLIKLSDSMVTVDGLAATGNSSEAVYVGEDIVYYEAGHDSSYGEGKAADEHTQEEAAKHTVVTITEPGVYRVSGKLSAGQLGVDLGKDAASDPTAVVTLILDGVDITNTVAPAVIFYNVYEPYSAAEDTKGVVDLSKAGAQVVLADGSVNTVNGSYVAKIYKAGTTKKLHKYDGAFYSKMSMNISGESAGTGELHIKAANEGLDSELHLTINGGKIYLESQDDGINTNEDGISVTTINGGYLHINAGLGAEGDGIDSNGYLTINGGTIITMANDRSPDGGIDADKAIAIHGGTVIALGTRNDATSSASKQPFMELSFATTQGKDSVITIKDTEGNSLLNFTAEKAFQSVTFSSSELKLDTEYNLYINGKQQQYTGNSFGMMGGGFGGFGGNRPAGQPPSGEGMNGQFPLGEPPAGMAPPENGEGMNEMPGGFNPERFNPNGQDSNAAAGEGSAAFILTSSVHSFSGISEATDASGKTKVTFNVNQGAGIKNAASGEKVKLEQVAASANVPESDIQLTVTDVPSESYSQTYLLSEIKDNLSKMMPQEDGQYRLTIAVVSSNPTYTGVSEWLFAIGVLPFTDLNPNDASYNAVKALYEKGIMIGTGSTTFSPRAAVTRAAAITTLGRLLGIEQAETSSFSDVAANSWYSGYVGWASENGLVIGDGNGHFMPEASLTTAQLKLVISRYAELNGLNISVDKLFPSQLNESVSRAELAVILNQLL